VIPEEIVEPAEIGTIGHKILEETIGKRFSWENTFFDELGKYQDPQFGLVRDVADTKIYCNLTGHTDDIQITIDRSVSVVENKFVMNTNLSYIQRWKLCMAAFQIQIYAWILDPIVKEMGGIMNRFHVVSYWNLNTFAHVHDFRVEYKPVQVEENILRCIRAYENPELIIRPTPWKCRYCSQPYRELCQFEAKNKQAN